MPSAWSWYHSVDSRWSFGVVEDREPLAPGDAELGLRLAGEEVVPGALGGVATGDVAGGGQEPGLGVAVALVADPGRAVQVGHDRHRTGVATRRGGERRPRVAAVDPAGRVGPVQGLIDGQQVRQVVAVDIHQLVDSLDPP